MITPTVGRVVWYYPQSHDPLAAGPEGPLAAIIAHVWNDRMVNLAVFDRNGVASNRTSIALLQDGDPVPELRGHCEWMPYQKGQAAKTEALQAQVAGNFPHASNQ